MTEEKHALQQLSSGIWGWVLVRGLALIALGILLLTRPGATVTVLVTLLGAYWVVDGALSIFESLQGKKHVARWGEGPFAGIITVIAGLVVFSKPLASAILTTTFLVYLLATAAILSGLARIIVGLRVRREVPREWLMIVAIGGLYVAFGLMLFARPFVSALAFVWVFGILALLAGVGLAILALSLRNFGRSLT